MTLEVERKFDLDPGQELPPLDGLEPSAEFRLEATYFDTIHFALTRQRLVVRHRTGGDDDGWHVKLPGSDVDHRVEHHAPPDAPRLPPGLRDLVADSLDGQALVPVARLRTRRRQAPWRNPAGQLLGLVCTDDVTATTALGSTSWREAEVELVGADPGLLDGVTTAFAAAGVHPATAKAKIARTLADVIAADDAARAGDPTAAGVVLDYVSRQVGTLQELEAGVLGDEPDAVHRSRVATRRLRSALRTFRALFDQDEVRRVRDELAWHAGELGAARDAEVLRDGLLEALDNLGTPAEAAERELIGQSLHEAHQRAHAELRQTMATPRYDRLQESLAHWLADPPLAAADPVPAAPILHGLLDRSRARVATGYLAALRAPDDPAGWHEVRKAAKAVRYCAEALEPVYGERAGEHAAAWEAVTDAFGELQDSVVARAAIADLDRESPALAALLAYQVGRGRAELSRGRAALDAARAASL